MDVVHSSFGRSAVAGGVMDPLLLLQNTRGEGGFPAPVLLPLLFEGLSWLC